MIKEYLLSTNAQISVFEQEKYFCTDIFFYFCDYLTANPLFIHYQSNTI